MIPFLGNIALILSLLIVVAQVMAPARFYRIGAISVFLLVLTSFLCLVYSYAVSDFSVLNVYNNSHIMKPMIYKISGAWGNHEGSMLLLILILTAYNLFLTIGREVKEIGSKAEIASASSSSAPSSLHPLTITAYITQLLITAGFLSFIIFTSSPFERIFPAPENGLGLNPLLQDVGLAMHPPVLYLGYIGFSVVFSLSIAALIHGEASREWARRTRMWVLASWVSLTLGIGLGSWWAYRELGWGGFWFWDPVENVSLMPWLAATALYHSLLVLEKRGTFALWSILLAIITFCLGLIGIFLVRSGIVSSVHAFASDPSRGVFILGFLSLTGLCAFTLFALRAGKFKSTVSFPALSRETAMLLNNVFFVTLSATVLLGTIYPIFLEVLSGIRVSVGAPYFNTTFNSVAIFMLIFTALAPSVEWGGGHTKWRSKLLKLEAPLVVGVGAGIVVYIKDGGVFSAIAVFVAGFLFVASILPLLKAKILPIRAYAMILAHCGVAVLVAGIAITTAFGVEKEQVLTKGEKLEFAGYEAVLKDSEIGYKENYVYRRVHFRILEGDNEIANLYPEIRVYPIESSSTLEAAIYYSLFSNIYAAVGEIDEAGIKYATRVYYKPMINLIWLGCVLMAFGGFLALVGRGQKGEAK